MAQAHANKIFGIGLSKTGTTSLGQALNQLGIATIDYPHDARTLDELERGVYRLSILEHYQAVTDTPVAPYYAQLDALYPGSKFILTVRDKDAWLRSAESHWQFSREWAERDRQFARFTYFICTAVYGCVRFNAERFSYVYDTHLRNVMDYFADRPDDLLVMDICAGDGWEKLCDFLGMPVPDAEFPRLNRKSDKDKGRQWMHAIDRAAGELRDTVPSEDSIVLVDDQQLADTAIYTEHRVRPFLERDGMWWGAPPDSDTAVQELERLREDGARFMAFAWPAFWWLDHYTGLAAHLRDQYACVIDSDTLIVFDLRTPRPPRTPATTAHSMARGTSK